MSFIINLVGLTGISSRTKTVYEQTSVEEKKDKMVYIGVKGKRKWRNPWVYKGKTYRKRRKQNMLKSTRLQGVDKICLEKRLVSKKT